MSDAVLDPSMLPDRITAEFVEQLSPETIAETLDVWGRVLELYKLQRVVDFMASPERVRLLTGHLQVDERGNALGLSGPVAGGFMHIIAAACIGMLNHHGASQYVESAIETDGPAEVKVGQLVAEGTDGRRFRLTIQAEDGLSPGQRAEELVDALFAWDDATQNVETAGLGPLHSAEQRLLRLVDRARAQRAAAQAATEAGGS